MSQFHPVRSYRDDAADVAGMHYSDAFQAIPSATARPGNVFSEEYPVITTEQLAALSRQRQAVPTEQITPLTSPLRQVTTLTRPLPQEEATTGSLLTALESTMAPPVTRQPTVIPGAKKSTKGTKAGRSRRLHPRLRYGIALGSIFVVLLISLLSLTPLGSGQSLFHSFSSIADWVQAQQQNWDMAGRNNTNGANTQANTTITLPPMNLPKSMYIAIAQQDAINAGINPDYFVRQINQESGFNPYAKSPAGAVGIAQFLPSTAAGLGIDPYDPIQALKGAAQYMANYAKQYNGDYAKALAAYNAGGGTVANAVRLGGANWMNFIPLETQNYIRIIMGI